jgi:hypothetical protein
VRARAAPSSRLGTGRAHLEAASRCRDRGGQRGPRCVADATSARRPSGLAVRSAASSRTSSLSQKPVASSTNDATVRDAGGGAAACKRPAPSCPCCLRTLGVFPRSSRPCGLPTTRRHRVPGSPSRQVEPETSRARPDTLAAAGPSRQAGRKREATYDLDRRSPADPWHRCRGWSQDRSSHVARQAGRAIASPPMESHGRRIAVTAGATSGPRTTGPQRTTTVSVGPSSAQLSTGTRVGVAGRSDRLEYAGPRPDRNVRSGFGVVQGGASATGKKLCHRLPGLDGGG